MIRGTLVLCTLLFGCGPREKSSTLITPDFRSKKIDVFVVADPASTMVVRETQGRAVAYLRDCTHNGDVSVVVVNSADKAARIAAAGKHASLMLEVSPYGRGLSVRVSALNSDGKFAPVGTSSTASRERVAVERAFVDGGASACTAWYNGLTDVSLRFSCEGRDCNELVGAESRFETKNPMTIMQLPWTARFPVKRRDTAYQWQLVLKDGKRLRAKVFADEAELRCSKEFPAKPKAQPDGWIDLGSCH